MNNGPTKKTCVQKFEIALYNTAIWYTVQWLLITLKYWIILPNIHRYIKKIKILNETN